MPLRNPPPEYPIVTFASPNKGDLGLIEFWNTEVASYVPLDIGAPHPNSRLYPGYTLGIQQALAGDEKWVKRVWVSPITNEDWFNYQIKYSAQSNDFPIFIRTYNEAKETYAPRVKGSQLQTLYKLILTDPGAGYTPGSFPSVSFDYGTATAHGVVNADGTLAELVIDSGGDGYTVPPIITVEDPPVGLEIGSVATGTAVIQPSGAILVSEEAQQYPADSEYYAQYFQVVRVYETIPGPVLTEQRFDEHGILHTITTQLTLSGAVTPIASELIDQRIEPRDSVVDKFTDDEAPKFFEDKSFAKEIPDVVPLRFRVAIPTVTEGDREVGIAALPTLVAGDLRRSEHQFTEFLKDVTVTRRDAVTLPVSLVSYKLTGDRQVETVTETLDAGLQTLSPDALLVEGDVQNLGNNQSLKMEGTVPDVFSREEFSIEIPDPIPLRFRVVAPTSTSADDEAGTASMPTLSTGDLQKSETQKDEFIVRKSTTTRAGVSLPVSLVSYKLTPDKQIETITETLDTGLQTITGVSATTVEAEVQNLGNNTSLLTDGEVPDVFGANVFGESIPDVIPIEFRAVVPTAVVEVTTAGTASDPTLATGDLEITETQLDEFRLRTRTTTRAGVSLPVSLVNKDTDKDKQVVTITTTLETAGTSTAVPDALTDVKVTNLGNNLELERLDAVPEVFDRAEYSIEIPDPIPQRFRVVAPTSTTALESAGTASMPTLGTGDLEASSRQVNEFVKRDSVSTRSAVSLPVSLVSYKLTSDQQIETITETLDTGLQTITGASATTVEAEVQNLGNNTSLLTDGEVPDVFDRAEYGIEIPDAIPLRFRVAAPTSTVALDSAGTASPPSLGTGDLSVTENQLTEFKMRTRTTTRSAVSLPVSLVSYKLTPDKQIETITETLDTGLQTITGVSATTVEAEVQNLGNNTSLLTDGEVPDVFGAEEFGTEIPDVIPLRFRVAVPTDTTGVTTAGTASAPTLSTGDLSITETQLDEFKLRTKTTTRSAVSLPVSLVSYKYTRDKQVETLTETLATGLQTITGAATTVEADVQNLGNGTSLKGVGTVTSVFGREAFAEEIPDVVPLRFRVAIPTATTEVSAAGTASDPTLGAGDLSIREEQEDEFIFRTTTRTRSAVSLPVSLVSYKYTKDKQVETVTETLASGLQTITGSTTTVEADVQNLGDGTSLKSVGTVASLFTNAEYSVEIPITIPLKFRPAVPISTVSLDSAGTASAPTLGTGDFSIKDEQIDAFNKRTTTQSIGSISLPVSLVSYRYRKNIGRIETITETLATGLQTLSAITALTTEADVQNLGNGTSLKTEATIASLFLRKSSGKAIEDIIPREFRGIVPTYTTDEDVAGTINDPPSLSTGDLEVVETQLDDYVKRVKRVTRDPGSLPVTLTGGKKIVEKFGLQLVADRVVTLAATGSQTIPTGPDVIEAEINEIGSGMEVLTTLLVDGSVWPIRTSTAYDDEMQVHYTIEEQVVAADYVDTEGTYFVETHRQLDQWHSMRRKVTKVPTAVDESTAIVSQIFAPYQFPGWLKFTGLGFYRRSSRAELVAQTVKKWWVISTTIPVVPFDEIIMDNPLINTLNDVSKLTYAGECLHDDFSLVGGQFFPATTPSATEYAQGSLVSSTLKYAVGVSNPGDGLIKYQVGQTYFFSGTGASGTIRVLTIQPGGYLGAIEAINVSVNDPVDIVNPYPLSVGAGEVNVLPYYEYDYSSGSRWIGTPRTISANVTPTEIPNLWKIQTRTIIMR